MYSLSFSVEAATRDVAQPFMRASVDGTSLHCSSSFCYTGVQTLGTSYLASSGYLGHLAMLLYTTGG